MVKKLFLLDGMALAYRAHFALISRPILTSGGFNTSALYGFTQTLLDIIQKQQPTHLAVAFDTAAPTHRHADFPEYKATRQAMPEDLSQALPHLRRLLEAFRVPALACDGYEADDVIGTLALRAQKEGFQCYMVTPDKDFGQLITEHVFIYKPGRMGDAAEILGPAEICARWGIKQPAQVVDVLALMGDTSDNIPGVPGIGEKTAIKLIGQFGTVENLLEHAGELTGRVKESLEKNRDQALLSKRLATILRDAPCAVDLDKLQLQSPDEQLLKALLVEFEFNSIGRRLFGDGFKAGRGFQAPAAKPPARETKSTAAGGQEELALAATASEAAPEPAPQTSADLKTIAQVPHTYELVTSPQARARLIQTLQKLTSFCLDTETTGLDPKAARLLGMAFSFAPHTGYYVPVWQGQGTEAQAASILEEFRPVLEAEHIEKVGHNLKFDLSVLRWHGVSVRGKLFDTMIAHSLIEPEMRHGMDYLSEVYLGYTPIPITKLLGENSKGRSRKSSAKRAPDVESESSEGELLPLTANASGEQADGGASARPGALTMADVPLEQVAEYSAEDADVTWQLRGALEPLLRQRGQERVFYEVESPLVPVLVEMEFEGIRVDAAALADFSAQLAKEIDEQEKNIYRLAGTTFNLNSPKQLGQVLFEVMKIAAAPKKTRTGQYSTDEQTLAALAPDHEVVQRLLEYRTATKLKTTYADVLPAAIWPATGRVHTTYNQVMTSTGRLNSQDPNVQNIPIRSDRGQEIRKAFVPRGDGWLLLSADYSQIELRILAALSQERGLLEAFRAGVDVHSATAAKVYGVFPEMVTPEMRRKAKMVNFGIAYGISAFGLAQRLRIPRQEAAEIIENYFRQFPGLRRYIDDTIAFARSHGYVETVTGRRRYLRDITSANNTIRGAAERNAINAPIQGTAADMIKLAMIQIQRELARRRLKTRMLLQVHDELVFDLWRPEEAEVRAMVEEKMKTAIPLAAPLEVEIGVGDNWLEAH